MGGPRPHAPAARAARNTRERRRPSGVAVVGEPRGIRADRRAAPRDRSRESLGHRPVARRARRQLQRRRRTGGATATAEGGGGATAGCVAAEARAAAARAPDAKRGGDRVAEARRVLDVVGRVGERRAEAGEHLVRYGVRERDADVVRGRERAVHEPAVVAVGRLDDEERRHEELDRGRDLDDEVLAEVKVPRIEQPNGPNNTQWNRAADEK